MWSTVPPSKKQLHFFNSVGRKQTDLCGRYIYQIHSGIGTNRFDIVRIVEQWVFNHCCILGHGHVVDVFAEQTWPANDDSIAPNETSWVGPYEFMRTQAELSSAQSRTSGLAASITAMQGPASTGP